MLVVCSVTTVASFSMHRRACIFLYTATRPSAQLPHLQCFLACFLASWNRFAPHRVSRRLPLQYYLRLTHLPLPGIPQQRLFARFSAKRKQQVGCSHNTAPMYLGYERGVYPRGQTDLVAVRRAMEIVFCLLCFHPPGRRPWGHAHRGGRWRSLSRRWKGFGCSCLHSSLRRGSPPSLSWLRCGQPSPPVVRWPAVLRGFSGASGRGLRWWRRSLLVVKDRVLMMYTKTQKCCAQPLKRL